MTVVLQSAKWDATLTAHSQVIVCMPISFSDQRDNVMRQRGRTKHASTRPTFVSGPYRRNALPEELIKLADNLDVAGFRQEAKRLIEIAYELLDGPQGRAPSSRGGQPGLLH
jgi:hypothetical protein